MREETERGGLLRTVVMCDPGETLIIQLQPWPEVPTCWHVAVYLEADKGRALVGPQTRQAQLAGEGRLEMIPRAEGIRDYRLLTLNNWSRAHRQITRSAGELMVEAWLRRRAIVTAGQPVLTMAGA